MGNELPFATIYTHITQYLNRIVTESVYWNAVVHCDVKWSAAMSNSHIVPHFV